MKESMEALIHHFKVRDSHLADWPLAHFFSAFQRGLLRATRRDL